MTTEPRCAILLYQEYIGSTSFATKWTLSSFPTMFFEMGQQKLNLALQRWLRQDQVEGDTNFL